MHAHTCVYVECACRCRCAVVCLLVCIGHMHATFVNSGPDQRRSIISRIWPTPAEIARYLSNPGHTRSSWTKSCRTRPNSAPDSAKFSHSFRIRMTLRRLWPTCTKFGPRWTKLAQIRPDSSGFGPLFAKLEPRCSKFSPKLAIFGPDLTEVVSISIGFGPHENLPRFRGACVWAIFATPLLWSSRVRRGRNTGSRCAKLRATMECRRKSSRRGARWLASLCCDRIAGGPKHTGSIAG